MRKLLASNFELDLTNYKLSILRENPWFSDKFFTKISFPFELDITDDLDAKLGFIRRVNSTDIQTLIPCKHYHNNQIDDAVLEIEQIQDKASATLEFGFDQLPNWDKKLSELPLERLELPEGTDIYEHAATIITESYPDVNYNFPQVHTDKIDPSSDDVWFAFEKIINNYRSGAFLINEVITEGLDDVTYNRNIMQPLPYILHILKKGFEDAGFTLAGTILSDTRLTKKLIYADVDYFTTVTQESLSLITMSEDFDEQGFVPAVYDFFTLVHPAYSFYRFSKTLTITQPGKYRLIGTVIMRMIPNIPTSCTIKYRNQIIWQRIFTYENPFHMTQNVDVVFSTLVDLLPNELTFESYQFPSADRAIFQLDVNPIRLHDAEGNPIPNIINKNEVDLTKAVPDITFGDLVTILKNWYNYDLETKDGYAIMNLVQDLMNSTDAVNLSNHEVKLPQRKFTKGNSFLLKFQDVDTKDYTFTKVFQNAAGVSTSSYTTDDKTSTIEITALPLPLLVRNGVQTVHAFESNNAKLFAVLYDGITSGLNLAKDPSVINLPAVHLSNWQKWFNFRIKTQEFLWSLRMKAVEFSSIASKSKIYAYGKYHIIKTINDTEVAPDEFEIEIETSTLE
jgi:hypothetical protein